VQENFLETKNLIKIKYELNLEGHYFAGTKNIFNHKFSFVVAMYSVSLHNYLLFFEQAKMEYINTNEESGKKREKYKIESSLWMFASITYSKFSSCY
jgi:hypothetical protein